MRQGLLYGAMLLLPSVLTQCSNDDGPDMKAPVLMVEEAVNVTRTTADVSGIIDANGNTIGECGFYYSVAKSDLTSGSEENVKKKPVSSQSGTVSVRLEGLEPNTTYFYCLYAKSGKTKVQSEILSFKTLQLGVPVLNAVELVEADAYSLRVSCSIAHNGGADLKEFGFQYRKENEATWKAALADAFDEGSSAKFTLAISDLEPATDYRVRAFAKNTKLTENGYSSEEGTTFRTEALLAPTVSILPLADENLGANWVKVVGNIESKGAADEVSGYGFCWSMENGEPTVADSKLDVPVGADQFSATVGDLVPGKSYYLRAFASNKVDGKTRYGYSETIIFTTKEFSAPELGYVECSNVTASGADLSCKLVSSGNGTVIERGFCWSEFNEQPTLNDQVLKVPETETDFKATLDGLEENKCYYVRAYVKTKAMGEEKMSYSETTSFNTLGYERPSFSNLQATDITLNGAKLSATINPGTATIKEKGFCYGKGNEPTTADSKAVISGNAFEATLSGLADNTTYYYRAYAVCQIGSKEETVYSYGAARFTTLSYKAPILSLEYPTEIGLYTAKLSATVTDEGDGKVTKRGFCWSTTEYEPRIESGKHDGMCELEEGSDFAYVMKDLKPGTSYYVRAYATATVGNATVTGYSSYQGFITTGLEKAGINMPEANNITATSFTLAASFYTTGNTDITETGFCWGTSQEQKPETLEKHKATLAEDGKNFSLTVSEQPVGSVYYVWAYATNGAGTVYSGPIRVALKGKPGADDNQTPEVL